MVLSNCSELAPRASGRRRTVIIGGGTVGLYAAHELCRRGEEVVVIEAGGNALDSFSPQSYASVGKSHEGLRLGRSRSLGGTSNLWGGQLVEFQNADFAGRDWLPDSKWPITYDEVARYYRPTYENLGIPNEVIDDGRIFSRVGGLNPDLEGGLEVFLTRWLKIPSFSVAYAHEIQTSQKLAVLLNHTVVGFRGANGTVSAIRVIDGGGNAHWVEGDRFILASGTIEISRLLLHAAATPGWECSWRSNENIGAYFQDHPVGRVASIEVLDRRRFFQTFSTIVWSGHKFQPKIRLTNETLQQSRVMNMHAMMSFESSVGENLVYLKQFLKAALYSRKLGSVGDLIKNLRACGQHLVPLMWKYMMDNRILVPSNSKTSLVVQSEQTPLRNSRISIDPAVVDGTGLPKVILDWKVGTEELNSIRDFAVRCDKSLRAAGLARLVIAEDLLKLEPRFMDTLRDNYHHVGGARMGENERDGVVDRNLRVFGTNNLYVVGAATFRTTSNANTTLTALALATRLVEHLSQSSTDSCGR